MEQHTGELIAQVCPYQEAAMAAAHFAVEGATDRPATSEIPDYDSPDRLDVFAGADGTADVPTAEALEAEALYGDATAYKRNVGFLFASDIGHRVFDHARTAVVPERLTHNLLQSNPFVTVGSPRGADSRSGASLYAVTHNLHSQLIGQVLKWDDEESYSAFCEQYGIEPGDVGERNRFMFENGLGDLEFTWHFAPAIANSVVASFEAAGYITSQQRSELTLSDWDSMLKTNWFHDLMHDMALTRNGMYLRFGNNIKDYNAEWVASVLPFAAVKGSAFNTSATPDSRRSRPLLSAQTSDSLRTAMRGRMKQVDISVGCPVARRRGTLLKTLVNSNCHAQNLIDTGRLVTTEIGDGKVSFEQKRTPIDVAIDVLAYHLHTYDQRFGMPVAYDLRFDNVPAIESNDEIIHESRPMTGLLAAA